MHWLLARRPIARNGSNVSVILDYRSHARSISKAIVEPLRILFCGSDEFSVESLKRLHAESLKDPNLIATIDVVCKHGKASGRGMRKIRDGKSNVLVTECHC